MAAYTPACKRCHIKKIKCDTNKPSCRPCTEANALCQPHERQRRFPSQRAGEDARRRLAWLEDGLSRQFGVNVRTIKTGVNLREYFVGSPSTLSNSGPATMNATGDNSPLKELPVEDNSEEFFLDVDPDISLLTLNATGELRYLGPSSGSFFAKYASNFARSFLSEDAKRSSQGEPQAPNIASNEYLPPATTELGINAPLDLTPRISKYLLSCYSKWVQPMFALLDQFYVETVLEPFGMIQNQQSDYTATGHESQRVVMIIYLLVLALGAVHVTSQEHDREEHECYLEYQDALSTKKLCPDMFFVRALDLLDSMCQAMQPSIPLIQITLLICIYGGYKPSGNRQWQLSGIAIRMSVEIGLHRHRNNWKFNEKELDLRRRVFWTAYAVELSAAYNLGRPPAIPDVHIDALFPKEATDNTIALHHVKLRQIQSRILSQVYCAPGRLNMLSDAEKSKILYDLQTELDEWREALVAVCSNSILSYPIQYWERLSWCTAASLLRPTPLFPRPSIESTIRCVQFAGKFIDIHHSLLKETNVPQSWMLLQGTLLSGVTILVTARLNAASLLQRDDFSLFEIMEWTRKCSLVLTIMSERWCEKSISDLEAKFSLLSNDTLKRLLALKDNPKLQDRGQEQFKIGSSPTGNSTMSGMSSSYCMNVPRVNSQVSTPQSSSWQYQVPFQSLPQGTEFARQNDMGSVNTPVMGDFLPDYLGSGGSMDTFSLEPFFGGDDLYSFWDVLPGADFPPLHFGQ